MKSERGVPCPFRCACDEGGLPLSQFQRNGRAIWSFCGRQFRLRRGGGGVYEVAKGRYCRAGKSDFDCQDDGGGERR